MSRNRAIRSDLGVLGAADPRTVSQESYGTDPFVQKVEIMDLPAKPDNTLEHCTKSLQVARQFLEGTNALTVLRAYRIGALLEAIVRLGKSSEASKSKIVTAFGKSSSVSQQTAIFSEGLYVQHSTAQKCQRIFRAARQYATIAHLKVTANQLCLHLSRLLGVLDTFKTRQCCGESVLFWEGTQQIRVMPCGTDPEEAARAVFSAMAMSAYR